MKNERRSFFFERQKKFPSLSHSLTPPLPFSKSPPSARSQHLFVFPAMQASLRLPSQGMAKVSRGLLDPGAGGRKVLENDLLFFGKCSTSLNLEKKKLSLLLPLQRQQQQRSASRSVRKSGSPVVVAQAVSAPTSAPASATQVRERGEVDLIGDRKSRAFGQRD